jgi:hypothetical protein
MNININESGRGRVVRDAKKHEKRKFEERLRKSASAKVRGSVGKA